MRMPMDSKSGDTPPNRAQETRARGVEDLKRLRCLNCGQNIFVAIESAPPDICQFCGDMTTWRLIDQ